MPAWSPTRTSSPCGTRWRRTAGSTWCSNTARGRRSPDGSPAARRSPPDRACTIIRQLLGALAAIHSRDIVHRDIKTANIILQPQTDGPPLVKLTDFGIARPEDDATLTQLTSLDTRGPGTPAYMAPERIDPQTFGALCAATDLYAAGIILYELLVGHPPFRGSMTEIFTGHLMQAPDLSLLPAGLPPGVEAVLARALAKRSDARYPNAAAFLAAVEAVERELAAAPGIGRRRHPARHRSTAAGCGRGLRHPPRPDRAQTNARLPAQAAVAGSPGCPGPAGPAGPGRTLAGGTVHPPGPGRRHPGPCRDRSGCPATGCRRARCRTRCSHIAEPGHDRPAGGGKRTAAFSPGRGRGRAGRTQPDAGPGVAGDRQPIAQAPMTAAG